MILVTGGCGFIGSNLIKLLLEETEEIIVNIDAFTYAANIKNLPQHERLVTNRCDIRERDRVVERVVATQPTLIYHLAAESHVDRSINSAQPFFETNVLGTLNLLEACRDNLSPDSYRFIYVSTDEVLGTGCFSTASPINPQNPYAASKAAGEHITRAFTNTYGINTKITRCTNNYGPNQHWEKFIPNAIRSVLEGKPIPVYGKGAQCRDWIHVSNHCQGLLEVGRTPGKLFHFGTGETHSNLEIATEIAKQMNGTICFVEDRKGHDHLYSMDTEPLRLKEKRDILEDIPQLIEFYTNRWKEELAV